MFLERAVTNVFYVDASYGVHWDSKGHTGVMMTMGRGTRINVSRKHKLGAGSSTELELVSIANLLGISARLNRRVCNHSDIVNDIRVVTNSSI